MTEETAATVTARILAAQGTRNARLTRVDEGSIRYMITEPFAAEIADMLADIDLKFGQINPLTATGAYLDAIVVDRLLEGRYAGEKATGYLQYSSSYPAVDDVIIPIGSRVVAVLSDAAATKVYFKTTVLGTIIAGTYSCSVAAVAVLPGLNGNVSPGEISSRPYDPIANVETVTNLLAFSGGTAQETDEELRDRYFAAVVVPGRATIGMLTAHLNALDEVLAAVVFSRGSGDVEILLDRSTGIAEPFAVIDAAIKEDLGLGMVARGCLAATVDPGAVVPDIGDAYGGDVWFRPRNHITALDQWSFLYIDMLGRARSGSVAIPAGTHRGAGVKAVLQDGDKAVSIPANTYAGTNTYDVLIGNGTTYPYLFNIPETVFVTVVVNVTVDDTAASTVEEDIRTSLAYFLNHHTIGQDGKYSQMMACVSEDCETGINIPGITEITLFQASGDGQTIRANGEHIDVEDDARIKAGTITVTVTVV